MTQPASKRLVTEAALEADVAAKVGAHGPLDVALAAEFVPRWQATTAVASGELRIAPDGHIIQSNSARTTRSSYDATEQGNWTVVAGGGGSSLARTTVKTSGYTAVASDIVPVDTTSAAVTVTLPNAPADKTQVAVEHITQGGTNAVTIATAGTDVFSKAGGPTTMTLPLVGFGALLQYDATSKVWTPLAAPFALAQLDGRYLQPSQVAPIAQAGQTPAQEPVAPGTANVGSQAVVSRADHVHPSAGLYAWMGPGVHGSLTFDGTTAVVLSAGGFANWGTNTMNPSSGVYTMNRDIYATNITINAGVTLKTNGYRIYWTGTFTNNGTVSNNGSNASGATKGNAAPGATSPGGTDGGNGGTTTGSATPSAGVFIAMGSTGGAGSSGAGGGANGNSITNYNQFASLLHAFLTRTTGLLMGTTQQFNGGSGGGGGGGDGTNSGGGGGGGGGILVANGNKLAGSGTFQANGGNGANGLGGNAGGGGAGGGGALFINCVEKSTWTGTTVANAGTVGSGVGTGATPAAAQTGWAALTVWG